MKYKHKKAKMFTAFTIICAAVIAFGGGVLALSATKTSTYDAENYVFDPEAGQTMMFELPARQSVEELRAPAVYALFERNEERELQYEGSWRGNGVQTDQYVDNMGGRYMFNGETGELTAMSFSYSEQARAQMPPENMTKADITAVAQTYITMYVPCAEQYALQEWRDHTDGLDKGEYNSTAYGVSYAIPAANDWFFESVVSVTIDSYGRLESMTLPNDDTYVVISEEEREAITKKLPTDDEWQQHRNAYLKEKYGDVPFEMYKEGSRYIRRSENGYTLVDVFEVSVGSGEYQYITQAVYEEALV